MLKISKKHTSADTKNMKKKFNPECIGIICAGTLMTGVIVKVAASCIDLGSIKEVDLKSPRDLNKAIFEIGDEEVSLDILGYSKNNKIKLKDGTILDLSDDNLILYNNFFGTNLKYIRNLDEDSNYMEYNGDVITDSKKTDRAIVEIGNSIVAVSITKTKHDKLETLSLVDGTSILVSDEIIKLYNSDSFVMKRIEEEFQAITFDGDITYKKTKGYDKALLIQNDDIGDLKILSYKIEDDQITLNLKTNNQVVKTDLNNVILYNSESSIINNIKDKLYQKSEEGYAMFESGDNKIFVNYYKPDSKINLNFSHIRLYDGTVVIIPESNMRIYNSKREMLKDYEEISEKHPTILVDDYKGEYQKSDNYDRALVRYQTDYNTHEISNYYTINGYDHTLDIMRKEGIQRVDSYETVFYNSKSYIMMDILNQLDEMRNEKLR